MPIWRDARLNTLLGRDPTAPLNVQGDYADLTALPAAQTLEELALQSRPDLMAAREAAERSHKEQALREESLSAGLHGFGRVHADAVRPRTCATPTWWRAQ